MSERRFPLGERVSHKQTPGLVGSSLFHPVYLQPLVPHFWKESGWIWNNQGRSTVGELDALLDSWTLTRVTRVPPWHSFWQPMPFWGLSRRYFKERWRLLPNGSWGCTQRGKAFSTTVRRNGNRSKLIPICTEGSSYDMPVFLEHVRKCSLHKMVTGPIRGIILLSK